MSANGAGGPTTVMVPANAGEVERQEFGARQIDHKAETAASVLATQARAAVEARFVMALQRPRDWETVRVRILAACKRPLFAERAIYEKPVGKKLDRETGEWVEQFAEGLNIRFAEEAVRDMGNAMTETVMLYDDPKKRIVRVSATDLETNVVHFKDITIEKTVERTRLKKGQQALGSRINSYGDPTFIVEATEDDLAKKEGALCAKAMRDKILMLLPSDIQEEARSTIKKTQADKDAKDPEAAKRKVIDGFAAIGVMPDQLAEYLGHDVMALLPAELQKLRAIYSAIDDGEATWSDVIEQKRDFVKEKAEKDRKKKEAEQAAAAKAGAQAAESAAQSDTPKPKKGQANLSDVAAHSRARRENAQQNPGPPGVSAADAREPGDDHGDEPSPEEYAAAEREKNGGK